VTTLPLVLLVAGVEYGSSGRHKNSLPDQSFHRRRGVPRGTGRGQSHVTNVDRARFYGLIGQLPWGLAIGCVKVLLS